MRRFASDNNSSVIRFIVNNTIFINPLPNFAGRGYFSLFSIPYLT